MSKFNNLKISPNFILEEKEKHITEGVGALTEDEVVKISTSLGLKTKKNTKQKQIESLKSQLSSTDYQVIKCYEYSLVGMELPYDIQTLHTKREAIREQIRELENEI